MYSLDYSLPYETFDILSDEEVRQGLKTIIQSLTRGSSAACTFGQLLWLAANGGNVHTIHTIHSGALVEEYNCWHRFNLQGFNYYISLIL